MVEKAVVYRSDTCVVCEAVDVYNNKRNGSQRVALKIIYEHAHFVKEYENYTGSKFEHGEDRAKADKSIVNRFDHRYVVKLLQAHYADISEVDPTTQNLLPTYQLNRGSKFRLLVTPMAPCTI